MVFDPSSGLYVSDGRLEGGGGDIRAVVTVYLKADEDWSVTVQVRDPDLDAVTALQDASAVLVREANEAEDDGRGDESESRRR